MARYPKQSLVCAACGAAQRDRFNLDRHWRRCHAAVGDVVVAMDGVQLRVGSEVCQGLCATERPGVFALRWAREDGRVEWLPVMLGEPCAR